MDQTLSEKFIVVYKIVLAQKAWIKNPPHEKLELKLPF